MTTTQKHTPTPWRTTGMLRGRGLKCRLIANDRTVVGQADTPEDAAFIVQAVNNHEALLEAAKAVINQTGGVCHWCFADFYNPLSRHLTSCPMQTLSLAIAAAEGRIA